MITLEAIKSNSGSKVGLRHSFRYKPDSSVGVQHSCWQDEREMAGLNPERDFDISENFEQGQLRRKKKAA